MMHFCLIILSCGSILQTKTDTAKGIMAAAEAKLKAARTLSGEASMSYVVKGKESPPPTIFKFSASKPSSYNLTTDGQRVLFDGKLQWIMRGETIMRRETVPTEAKQVFFLKGFESFFKTPSYPPVRLEQTDWNGKRVVAAVLNDHAGTEERVFFDAVSKLPCGFEVAQPEGRMIVTYPSVILDAPIGGKEFSFTPPTGAKVVDLPKSTYLQPGVTVPDFTLSTASGEKRTLYTLMKGHKVTLINFWFVGCAPCRAEYPHLEQMSKELGPKGLQIVSVNNGDSPTTVAKFLKDNGYTFNVVLNGAGRVVADYGVQAFPTNFIVNERGKIIASFEGYDRARMLNGLKLAGIDVDQ